MSVYQGWRDAQRLRRRFPALANYDRMAAGLWDSLRQVHEPYVAAVSSDLMAASLELSVLLTSLCRILHPWRVVDLGSGFSSYVLRLYAAQAKPSPEVWSVDDSAEWLNKTREYLSALGLSTANLGTWEDFAASGQSGFDLILHDLGNMETRAGALPRVIELGRPGAMIVLDDVHKGTYRRAACAALRRRRLPCWSLRSFTLDRFGRYAWLTETR